MSTMSRYTQLVSDELREAVEEYIFRNKLKAGDALPSERKLSEMLQANRMTLRRALNQMAGEGVIYSIPGQGTFISQPKFYENTSGFISFTSSWNTSGKRTSSKVLSFSEVEANLKTSQMLGVPLGAKVYELRRLRLLEDIPVSIEASYIQVSSCPGLMRFDFNRNRSLYETLDKEYGIHITRQQQNIRATKVTEEEAEIFCSEPGINAFYVTSVGICTDGRAMERSISVTRADRYAISYHTSLK